MIREIYIEKKFPVAPIYWVYGTTGLQIGFEILDFDLASVSSVKFCSQTQSGIRYEATGTKNGSVVLFKPVAGFFAVGHNTLQCELVASPGTVYSFAVAVFCEENNKFYGTAQDPSNNTLQGVFDKAIEDYFKRNPASGGVAPAFVSALQTILRSVAYYNEDVSALIDSLSAGGSDTPSEPTQNPVSVSYSGTIATINNLKNLTVSYNGNVASVGV